jgi:hypothetical protein
MLPKEAAKQRFARFDLSISFSLLHLGADLSIAFS